MAWEYFKNGFGNKFGRNDDEKGCCYDFNGNQQEIICHAWKREVLFDQ